MINSKNGNLNLNDFELTPFSKFELTDQFQEVNIQEIRDFNNGWKWLGIINLKVDNRYFDFSLGYYKNRLNLILLTFKESPSVDKSTWKDWSEEKELNNQKKFENWLNNELDEVRNFNWGDIHSIYDSKSGFASINIDYKKN